MFNIAAGVRVCGPVGGSVLVVAVLRLLSYFLALLPLLLQIVKCLCITLILMDKLTCKCIW